MEVEEEGFGVELAEDGALISAGLGVPLGGGAASGEESEGEFGAGGLGERGGRVEEEFRAARGGGEFFVLEEAAFVFLAW